MQFTFKLKGMDDTTLRHIRRAVKLNSFLGYHPYTWSNHLGGRVTFDRKNRRKRLFFYFQLGLYWLNQLLLTIWALYVTFFHSEGTSVSTRIDNQYVAVGYFGSVTFQLCSFIFCSRLHVMLNHYLSFRAKLQVEWIRLKPKMKCESAVKFQRGLLVFGTVNTVSNVMTIWRKPQASNVITAFVPGVASMPKWTLFPFAVIQFFIQAHPWHSAYLYFTMTFGLTADMANALELMRYATKYH